MCVCVCVPDPVIDEICKRALLEFILASKVLLGICQGYSIRIDWLLIDGAWRKLFPYTGPNQQFECAEENALARALTFLFFYFLMDWRSRRDTGARPSDESNLVEYRQCFFIVMLCALSVHVCVLYAGHTNNNRRHNNK